MWDAATSLNATNDVDRASENLCEEVVGLETKEETAKLISSRRGL